MCSSSEAEKFPVAGFAGIWNKILQYILFNVEEAGWNKLNILQILLTIIFDQNLKSTLSQMYSGVLYGTFLNYSVLNTYFQYIFLQWSFVQNYSILSVHPRVQLWAPCPSIQSSTF